MAADKFFNKKNEGRHQIIIEPALLNIKNYKSLNQ